MLYIVKNAITTKILLSFLQAWWRMIFAQQQRKQKILSAIQIQRTWRGYVSSAWFRKLKTGIVIFQAHTRGYLLRMKIKSVIFF